MTFRQSEQQRGKILMKPGILIATAAAPIAFDIPASRKHRVVIKVLLNRKMRAMARHADDNHLKINPSTNRGGRTYCLGKRSEIKAQSAN